MRTLQLPLLAPLAAAAAAVAAAHACVLPRAAAAAAAAALLPPCPAAFKAQQWHRRAKHSVASQNKPSSALLGND
jgi:hypothetical protein